MTQQLLDLALVRAWQNYFRTKGGESPRAPSDILPVVILDDNSRGPFPACRMFMAGPGLMAAVAGQVCYTGILNNDIAQNKSVVVIDEIFVRVTVADDVMIMITIKDVPAAFAAQSVSDVAEDKDQTPTTSPAMSNVQVVTLTSATPLPGSIVPHNQLTVLRIPGPFTIGPQAQLLVRPGVVNNGLEAFFRGRYYPPL